MYYLREEESIALRAVQARKGLRVLTLEGPPGTGKTAFSEFLAEKLQAKYHYFLNHNWVTEEELFYGISVGRVAAGITDPEQAYEPGILARVATSTVESVTVLCLDELDKAPAKTEALLLDFLQNGRVPAPGHRFLQAKLENLVVVITTNGIRPLSEALLRRSYRIKMSFLPPHIEADLIRKATGAPMGAIRAVVRMMGIIRANGATAPSLQEGRNLVQDLKVAASASEVNLLIQGWLCKEPEDWLALCKQVGSNPGAILWGEYSR